MDKSYLIGLFCRSADAIFFDSLHKNIEKTLDTTNNIILLGDMNVDLSNLLNPNRQNLKDDLLLNSLQNIISEPARQLACYIL